MSTDQTPDETKAAGRVQAACPYCAGQAERGITLDPGRRRFLKMLAFGGAAVAAGGVILPTAAQEALNHYTRPARPAAQTDRRLLVIELPGGNDGLSTLVPHGTGTYYDRRPRTAIPAEEVIDLDGQVGLHPNLTRLHTAGLTVLQGVGTPVPDLSHFAMFDRWWRGDLDGTAGGHTGFLGRLSDQLMGEEVATAVTLGWGPTPALVSERATTVALPEPESGEVFAADDEFFTLIRHGLRAMSTVAPGAEADHEWLTISRSGMKDALDFAAMLQHLPDPSPVYDTDTDDHLMVQMAVAGRLLAAEGGPRIIHVPMDADFDTHEGHDARYHGFMERLDIAVDALLRDLDGRGIADTTLIATTSEFGRRVADNESAGVDHGAASVALLAGPLTPGLVGEHPSLDALDEEGNLVATVGFDRYYATLAEGWFGVPASEVLPGNPPPLRDVL